jgi:hypothetical protein
MWRLPRTSGYSYTRVAAIQTDVHHAGENSTNMTHAFHAQSAYDSHVVRVQQPFISHQQSWTGALLPRKSAPAFTSQPGWVAHKTRLSFSPNTTIEAVRLSQTSVDDMLLGLLDSYHQHVIDTFNTYSRGPTHRSLTNIGRGYNLRGPRLAHHTPDLPNWRSSTFHLRAPPGIRLSI